MPRVALAFLFFVIAAAALAEPETAQAPARPGGWIRDDYGVWRHVGSAYHVAYMRRGCRIEEDWDGLHFSAQMRCQPGVRPD